MLKTERSIGGRGHDLLPPGLGPRAFIPSLALLAYTQC
jgi:hypothetical protein